MNGKIPYYTLRKRSGRVRGYWQPTKAMRDAGFGLVSCGEDGPSAWKVAEEWNRRWQLYRGEVKTEKKKINSKDFGYIYFIKMKARIKIGFSRNPSGRMSSLKTGLSDPIERVVFFKGNKADEKRLHLQLSSDQLQGEWFSTSDQVVRAMVRCANHGANGIEYKPKLRTRSLTSVRVAGIKVTNNG